MNNIQKLIYIPMQRNILKCYSSVNKQTMLAPIFLSKRSEFKNISNKAGNISEVDNQPVKYTVSAAGKFKARSSLRDDDNKRLWYEPYVIMVSLGAFLIYFLVLREENDLDQEIYMPLGQRIASLEQTQLKSLVENSNNHEEIANAKLELKKQ